MYLFHLRRSFFRQITVWLLCYLCKVEMFPMNETGVFSLNLQETTMVFFDSLSKWRAHESQRSFVQTEHFPLKCLFVFQRLVKVDVQKAQWRFDETTKGIWHTQHYEMTLERHKSKLIPDVDFNLEGRLFVTDVEGTFPIRGGTKSRDKLPGPEEFTRPHSEFNDVNSFRSYDPKRDRDKKRKYKPNEPSKFGQEVANLPPGGKHVSCFFCCSLAKCRLFVEM